MKEGLSMKNAIRTILGTLSVAAFLTAAVATYVAVSQNYPLEITAGGLEGAAEAFGVVIMIFILILGEFEVLRLLIFLLGSRRNDRRLLKINVLLVAISLFMAAFELVAVFGPVPDVEWLAWFGVLLIFLIRLYYFLVILQDKVDSLRRDD